MSGIQDDRTAVRGIGRYQLLRELGRGGMGVVYEAVDTATGMRVALKTFGDDPGGSEELKAEFRRVADLAHPNLVLLYELAEADGTPFFTMEFVDGQDFVSWVRDAPDAERADRVRSGASQLCHGLVSLHARGLVHRDVKPSNVLVDRNGRVVLLDFGLARQIERDALDPANPSLAGTLAYLAPELLRGAPATPASDAWALGMLLQQAVGTTRTDGVLPYRLPGTTPVRSELLPGVPADFGQILARLLEPDPERRADLADVLADLDARPTPDVSPAPKPRLVDRQGERAAMRRAWSAVAEGAPSILHVTGPAGMGKSALLRAFSAETDRPEGPWVLQGRSYEHDAVPYKAIDGAIDDLARRLRALPDATRQGIGGDDGDAAAELFPALRCLSSRPAGDHDPVDGVARRRRGTQALKAVLGRVARTFGLVLILDDLQWGDLDSARLLVDLVTGPTAPALMVVLAYRSGLTHPGAFLSSYLPSESAFAPEGSGRVPIGPLGEADATDLASHLQAGSADLQSVVRDSEGCPFIIEILATAPPEHRRAIGVDGVLMQRVASLPPDARLLLDAVALAGRPIRRAQVPGAPEDPAAARAAWSRLAADRLIRTGASAGADHVEMYHDRIRAAVRAALSDDARGALHRSLARRFGEDADVDHEAAALHHHAGGEPERALPHARQAAEAASSALAFDRAASLWQLAIECTPVEDHAARIALIRLRARALADAGRGTEAAPLFLDCAAEATGGESLDLRRLAVEQYLISGRIDAALPVLRPLMQDVGMWYPRWAWAAQALLFYYLIRLLLRGPRPWPTVPISDEDRLRLEVCLSVGKGFGSYDPNLGSAFFFRATWFAMQVGDVLGSVSGMAYVGAALGYDGRPASARRGLQWIERAEALAEREGDGRGFQFCGVARGMIHACGGQWREAIVRFDAAAHQLDTRFAGMDWESNIAKNTVLFAMVQLGDISGIAERAAALGREAEHRGDASLLVESDLYLAYVRLAQDDPKAALVGIEKTIGVWTDQGYHFQHWIAMRFRVLSELYEGVTHETLSLVAHGIRGARRGGLTGMQVVRIEAAELHGKVALAAAVRDLAPRRGLLREVTRSVRQLRREDQPHSLAPASVLLAGAAWLSGDRAAAARCLEDARRHYLEADMPERVAAVEWKQSLLGGAPDLRARAHAHLTSLGIQAPERWVEMAVPVVGAS